MDLHAYQAECERTAVYTRLNAGSERVAYCALALAGEAGEVANAIKKIIRDHGMTELDLIVRSPLRLERRELELELGDVLWYVTMLAHECGLTLENVAQANLEKLRVRYGRPEIGK